MRHLSLAPVTAPHGPSRSSWRTGLGRRAVRLSPIVVLGAGYCLSWAGLVPADQTQDASIIAFAALTSILLAAETRDGDGAGVNPACSCHEKVSGLAAEVAALQDRLDAQDEAWLAWHASHGCSLGRPRLSAVDGPA